MDAEQQEMLIDFVSESLDMLDTVEPMIIGLDQQMNLTDKTESVNTMFRLFHTLKGGAGFLNLDTIQEVTHAAESLLQYYRKDPVATDPVAIEILTEASDLIRQMLEQVESQFGDEGFEKEAGEIIRQLQTKIAEISVNPNPSEEETAPLSAPPVEEGMPVSAEQPVLEAPEETPASPAPADVDLSNLLLTPEMMQSFIQEAEEQLESTEGSLLVVGKLNGDGDSIEFIETAFRSIHTLKGNSGFLGLVPIEQLSHKMESVLEKMKEGALDFQEDNVQILLKVVDILRVGIKSLGEKQELELPDYELVSGQLSAIIEGQSALPPSATSDIPVEPLIASTPSPRPEPESFETQVARDVPASPEPLPPELPPSATLQEEGGQNRKGKAIPLKQPDIRVSIDKIDQLINLVGELVISEAMVTHNPDVDMESERFVKASRQLNKNVRDLQEVAMSMRMLPISGTFRKMIRVVHDVSKKISKNVELELQGEETEVDRTLVEQIADPLLHIIRNAVDHGIETPEERELAGKSKMGKLLLEARHAGNEIWITISDDGRGLNREKILNRAEERGLIPPNTEFPDHEVWKMVFSPGFSTAETVTDFSGRGVGMDVVKRNIEKLRGRVDVTSTPGKGSTFILRIPLTLAIIEGMLIRVGGAIYVIPIEGIRESLQPTEDVITETTDGMEVIRIRDELVRVVRLHQLHYLNPDSSKLSEGIVIVIEDEEQRVCLFVDEVVGERQVVVKGLPLYFGEIPHLAGCTILGDGDISLILDLNSIIHAH